MPALRSKMVSIYVRPSLAEALTQTAEAWGCSVSDAVLALIRWGHWGLAAEAERQGAHVELQALTDALALGMALWGPLTPLAPKPRELRELLDAALQKLEDDGKSQ